MKPRSGRTIPPVSYTHLDVYKRQELEKADAEKQQPDLTGQPITREGDTLTAVSYTHLVY